MYKLNTRSEILHSVLDYFYQCVDEDKSNCDVAYFTNKKNAEEYCKFKNKKKILISKKKGSK